MLMLMIYLNAVSKSRTDYIIFKNSRLMVPEKWGRSSFGIIPMKFKLLFAPSLSFIERKNKMTVIKCLIVILAFLVSRVAGILSTNEDTNSRDRIESVSRNFEKYWITSKGMNEQVENMVNQYFSDRMS